MTVYLNIPFKPLMLSFKNWQKRISLSYCQTEILLTDVCVLAKGINFKRRKIVDRKWQMQSWIKNWHQTKRNDYFGSRWNPGIKTIPSARCHNGWCKTMVSPPPLFSVKPIFLILLTEGMKKGNYIIGRNRQNKQNSFCLKKIPL